MVFLLWIWACDELKPTTGQRISSFKKHVTSMRYTLEPAIKSGDTGQRMPLLIAVNWLLDVHKDTYMHTYILYWDSLQQGVFSHNVNYIILVIKKRKKIFTVVQLNWKYVQNYSKYIQNYFVWNILLKSLRLKLSISLVFLILSGSPFHSFGPRK